MVVLKGWACNQLPAHQQLAPLPWSAKEGRILQKTELRAWDPEENGIPDSAVSSKAFILPAARLQAGMLQTDGEAH